MDTTTTSDLLGKHNTQVVSSLKTESDYKTFNSETDDGSSYQKSMQDDMISIAESIHNLLNVVDEQNEKINSIEEKYSRMVDDIKAIKEMFSNGNSPKTNTYTHVHTNNNTKNKETIPTKVGGARIQVTDTETNSVTESFINPRKDRKSVNIWKGKNKNSFNETETETDYLTEQTPTGTDKGTKEVKKQLNNISKEFNDELLNVKRKNALLVASYVRKK